MKVCSVCTSPDRAVIDTELLRGSPSLREIEGRTGLSKTSLIRHKPHIPRSLATAKRATEMADAGALLEQLAVVCADCRRLQQQAEKSGDVRAALQALQILGAQLQNLMKIGLEVERQRNAGPNSAERVKREVHAMSDADLADALEKFRATSPQLLGA